MFEHIFRIVIAKISILPLNRINATEPNVNGLAITIATINAPINSAAPRKKECIPR